MASITTINAGDNISSSRTDINTNFANLNSDKIETSALDTDTAMAANSDAKIPSQKAVKTYIDTQGGANASTTVRGIVEEATQAELTAGTQTGATGARLSLNPVHTASTSAGAADEGKLPRLNGSGRLDSTFLGVGKVAVNTTEITLANSAAETTLFSVTVPGGSLSTSNALRMSAFLSDFECDSSESIVFRLKYGSTTVASISLSTTGATSSGINLAGAELVGYVLGDGSASAQKGALRFVGGDGVLQDDNLANTDGEIGISNATGSGTETSANDLTLSLTAQWAAASASNTLTAEFWIVEKIA